MQAYPSPQPRRSALSRYSVALLLVIVATIVRTTVARSLMADEPMLIFVIPALVASWFGGFGPGFAATMGGGFAGLAIFAIERGSLGSTESFAFVLLVLAGITVSALNERLHLVAKTAEADAASARQNEDALRASEERYRLLADSMHDVITLLEPDGRVLFISPSVTDRLGWHVEEVIGRNAFEYVHPDDRPRMAPRMQAVDEGHTAGAIAWRCRCRDGSWRWLETNTAVLPEDASKRRRLLWTSRDITDRRLLEEQLRQAQKMEAIGRLAGGVAHDFNNVLTVILGYAASLEYAVEPSDPIAPQVGEIRVAAERAARLTQQLLAFSRQQVLQPRALDLNGIIGHLGSMLQRLIGTHITLETELDEKLWPALVDPGQMEQVFMNLVVNARDAMRAGGTITIRTRRAFHRSAKQEQGVPIPSGEWVVCEVSDTGSGMPAAVVARIFEPFFTTKPVGSGTGLGLSMVYGIIKQSGGYIFAESALHHGTTIRIYLPRAQAMTERAVSAKSGDLTGRGVVLLVEDEPAVRSLVASVLRGRGFTIYEAGSGPDALAILDQLSVPIDLLVTDVIMPEISGVELARRVIARHRNTPVLYMSGYADDVLRRERATPGAAFLQKPFSPEGLLARVREVLEPAVDARKTA